MNSRRRTNAFAFASSRDAFRAWEVAVTAPQVIALRCAGMVAAGLQPGAREREEYTRMWSEKAQAFGQGWVAMLMESWLYPARLASAMSRTPFAMTAMPFTRGFGLALAPVHRTVRANHRRLTRRRASTLR